MDLVPGQPQVPRPHSTRKCPGHVHEQFKYEAAARERHLTKLYMEIKINIPNTKARLKNRPVKISETLRKGQCRKITEKESQK